MPPRKPSPVGSHVPVGAGLLSTGPAGGLGYARAVDAEVVQLFVANPRAWRPAAGDATTDAAFATACRDAGIAVYVHAAYLVNLASPSEPTRARSLASLQGTLARSRRLGARGVVVHAGASVTPEWRDQGMRHTRAALLPLLTGLAEDDPDVLIEPTAGGGTPLAATVDDLGGYVAELEGHPRVGLCLDTCHAFAAGHDLASPGGLRRTLNALVREVGRGRLRLVHANDSRDPVGSGRDRHCSIGAGRIGAEPFGELFRHPATRGVPVLVETPGSTQDHARDVATLKALRDR